MDPHGRPPARRTLQRLRQHLTRGSPVLGTTLFDTGPASRRRCLPLLGLEPPPFGPLVFSSGAAANSTWWGARPFQDALSQALGTRVHDDARSRTDAQLPAAIIATGSCVYGLV
ncbi:hypothetical protein GCM10020367_14800 [Streptomyces sannanensis]|uniref:Uncharacterized protein n=1 Tax=Streptomyces sannanensis TaxID=285536 RepID=A0ABP6S7T0_9ACTN